MNQSKVPEKKSTAFLWGASTAAHQVEGNNHNSWSIWEPQNAHRLAKIASKHFAHLSSWEHIKEEAQDPNTYISGEGVDHLNRYPEDIEHMKEIGLNSYRFSIEWSRIEPQDGVWDFAAVEHYRTKIRALKQAGIEPLVTLWHWTNPVWFEKQGGWEAVTAIFSFSRYVEFIAQELGEEITYCMVLNEPLVYSIQSYLHGVFPPQKKNFFAYHHVINTLIVAQYRGYAIFKRIAPHAQVGTAVNLAYVLPLDTSLLTKTMVSALRLWDTRFLRLCLPVFDFIGVNYYFRTKIKGFQIHHSSRYQSDLGWGLHPNGIYHVLTYLKQFNKPIIISENGVADAKDTYRSWWLEETINSIDKARQEDVPVIGYMHWSLLDNFEWDKGYWPRFGLIHVDLQTKKRTIRPSAYIYQEYIRTLKW